MLVIMMFNTDVFYGVLNIFSQSLRLPEDFLISLVGKSIVIWVLSLSILLAYIHIKEPGRLKHWKILTLSSSMTIALVGVGATLFSLSFLLFMNTIDSFWTTNMIGFPFPMILLIMVIYLILLFVATDNHTIRGKGKDHLPGCIRVILPISFF